MLGWFPFLEYKRAVCRVKANNPTQAYLDNVSPCGLARRTSDKSRAANVGHSCVDRVLLRPLHARKRIGKTIAMGDITTDE